VKYASYAMAVLSGVLFSLGFVVADMVSPKRTIGLLNLAGHWDPTLIFGLGTAIGVYALATKRIRRRSAPWFSNRFHVPTNKQLDRRLIGGAALFGVGWGLTGWCPSVVMVSIGTGAAPTLTFAATMIVGMALAKWAMSAGAPSTKES
jgi:uncharacterized membrane protein YedE/YeeE